MAGYDLVALIFVREINEPLTSLVKRIDRQIDKVGPEPGRGRTRGVFIIFLNDDPALKRELQTIIGREALRHVVFATHPAAGPPRYKIAPEADTTVAVYSSNRFVTTNLALRKGELNRDNADEIFCAITTVLGRLNED